MMSTEESNKGCVVIIKYNDDEDYDPRLYYSNEFKNNLKMKLESVIVTRNGILESNNFTCNLSDIIKNNDKVCVAIQMWENPPVSRSNKPRSLEDMNEHAEFMQFIVHHNENNKWKKGGIC